MDLDLTTLGKSRRSARSVVDRLVGLGRLVEIEYDPHRHRSGLCTLEQAESFARERDAMKRIV